MKIGFIGLGNMGAPMAANLAEAGHQVLGYDTAAPEPDGVSAAASAAEAAADADVVITMLPNGKILRSVADQVIPAMRPGAVFCDCSTVDVDSARAVAEQARDAGLGALDAPVSGGIGGAQGGTLTFMVGGDLCHGEAAFRHHRPEGRALRRSWRGTGGQDLQQHDPGRDHDRHLRGLRAGRQAGAGPAEDVRRGLDQFGL